MMNQIPEKPTHRKRSPFYWWRRFPTHQGLHNYSPLMDRIKNGDFNYPEYFEQAKWEDHWCGEDIKKIVSSARNIQDTWKEQADITRKYAKRRNLLIEDGFKTEQKRLEEITKQFAKVFGGTKKDVWDFMQTFDGTLEEMHWAYAESRGIKKPQGEDAQAIVNRIIGEMAKKRGRGRPPKNPTIQ
jgi:hypothetical protein